MTIQETGLMPLDSTAITIPSHVLEQMRELSIAASNVEITDAASFAKADAINGRIRKWTKDVEAFRKEAKQPYLSMGKKIDAKAKELTEDLKRQTASLSREIMAYQRKLEEEERQRRAEEQRLTEERLRAEREAQERATAAANKLAAAARERDQAKATELRREAAKEAEQHRLSQVKAMQAEAKANQAAAPVERVQSSSVTTMTRKVLVIHDQTQIPHAIQVDGVTVELLSPIEGNIKRALLAGATIPGCSIQNQTTTRSK